jgi:hypothetical protein
MATKYNSPVMSKTDSLLKMLRSKNGASLSQLAIASGWQTHSVRGFLAATVKKRLGLKLESYHSGSGERRYRLQAGS